MNETVIAEAVRQLVLDDEATIVANIYFQGEPKAINVVTTSTLTPPSGYPHFLVTCTEAREGSRSPSSNLQQPPRMAIYDMVIEITDQAFVVEEESFPYQQMQDDFRLMTDRVAYFIKKPEWITYGGQSAQLLRGSGAEDRKITKRNLSGYWQDTEQNWWATLNCQILFSLSACPDDSLILPD